MKYNTLNPERAILMNLQSRKAVGGKKSQPQRRSSNQKTTIANFRKRFRKLFNQKMSENDMDQNASTLDDTDIAIIEALRKKKKTMFVKLMCERFSREELEKLYALSRSTKKLSDYAKRMNDEKMAEIIYNEMNVFRSTVHKRIFEIFAGHLAFIGAILGMVVVNKMVADNNNGGEQRQIISGGLFGWFVSFYCIYTTIHTSVKSRRKKLATLILSMKKPELKDLLQTQKIVDTLDK